MIGYGGEDCPMWRRFRPGAEKQAGPVRRRSRGRYGPKAPPDRQTHGIPLLRCGTSAPAATRPPKSEVTVGTNSRLWCFFSPASGGGKNGLAAAVGMRGTRIQNDGYDLPQRGGWGRRASGGRQLPDSAEVRLPQPLPTALPWVTTRHTLPVQRDSYTAEARCDRKESRQSSLSAML